MGSLGRLARVALFAVAMALGARSAAARDTRADEATDRANGDPTYGRVDGDLGVSVGAGVTLGPSAPRGTVDLRLRYLDTAGLFGFYEDGFSATSSDPRRVLGGGFELRPLFLGRWLVGSELRIPWLDLFIDSFGLEIATFFEQPVGGAIGARPGIQASLGIEFPFLPRASGVWVALHGGVRWSDEAIEAGGPGGPASRAAFLTLTVAYHQIFGAHLVDANDVAPR